MNIFFKHRSLLILNLLITAPLFGTLEDELQETKRNIEQLEQIIEMREKRIDNIYKIVADFKYECKKRLTEEQKEDMEKDYESIRFASRQMLKNRVNPTDFFKAKFFKDIRCNTTVLKQIQYGLIRISVQNSLLREDFKEYQKQVTRLAQIKKELRGQDH